MIWEKRGGVAYSTVTEAILTASGLSEEELLHPEPNSYITLDGLQQAAEVILRARDEGRPAVIIGDYDVDGITSTAILSMLLSFLSIEHTTIIPKRFTEGYGVSTPHVKDVSNALNQDRKRMVEAYLSLACDSAQGQSSPIVVYLPGLLEGLLGVVAGRLIGTFNSTVVVLSDSRDGKAIKGSVRAVPGDNAKELLDSVRNLLTVYGGHSGAAGMTLERANLDAFTDALKEMRSSHSVCSNLLYDVELSQETVFRSMRALNRFEPLGHGVPNPVCVIRNVEVQDVAYMGQDKNTVKLVCDGFSILGFGKAELYRKHNEPRTLDVIGTLSENHFRGRTTIQVVAEDFHPCIF